MNRAVKIRIYPDKEQSVQIEKTIGCSRFIYNQMLADKISYYQKEKKMLRNTPAGYKKEYPWLKEVDSLALANAQLHLESAFRKKQVILRSQTISLPQERLPMQTVPG